MGECTVSRSVSLVFVSVQKKGERPDDRIKMWDAAVFPFYASGVLFGLYIVFKVNRSLCV